MSHVKFAAGLELYDVQLPYSASPTLYFVLFMSAIFGFVLGSSVYSPDIMANLNEKKQKERKCLFMLIFFSGSSTVLIACWCLHSAVFISSLFNFFSPQYNAVDISVSNQ